MPSIRVPKYCHHRATNQARVWLDGKDHYLGEYGSEESWNRYRELVDRWKRAQLAANDGFPEMTCGQLALLFIRHCDEWYVKGGRKTSQVHLYRSALRPFVRQFKGLNIREFGPIRLKAVREEYIARGNCRETVNRMTRRIVAMFRWAVSEEFCGASVLTALETVKGLQAGRTVAKDRPPVKPVPEATVNATMPHMTPTTRATVQVQLLTGMRPAEVLSMCVGDVDTSGDVWVYVVKGHKTAHLGKMRTVLIGPQAQDIIRPLLTGDAREFVFSPHHDRRKAMSVPSYRRSINRACEASFAMPSHLRVLWKTLRRMVRDGEITVDEVPAKRRELSRQASAWRRVNCWNPARLRHNFATAARAVGGIESARVTLGHTSAVTSEIYAEADLTKARAVLSAIG